jgi:dUTP pyrophosphatase
MVLEEASMNEIKISIDELRALLFPPVKIRVLRTAENAKIPVRATSGSSGYDLYAIKPITIYPAPGNHLVIPTGLEVAIPYGYELQIRAKSGLAAKAALTTANGIGTIDSDYRGSLGVIMINLGQHEYEFNVGDKVAQVVCCKVEEIDWEEVKSKDELGNTSRGSGGYGSTGK